MATCILHAIQLTCLQLAIIVDEKLNRTAQLKPADGMLCVLLSQSRLGPLVPRAQYCRVSAYIVYVCRVTIRDRRFEFLRKFLRNGAAEIPPIFIR